MTACQRVLRIVLLSFMAAASTALAEQYSYFDGEALISTGLNLSGSRAPQSSKLARLSRTSFASLTHETLSDYAVKVSIKRRFKLGREALLRRSKLNSPCNAPPIKRLLRTSINLQCEPNWSASIINTPSDTLLSSMYPASTTAAGGIFLREAWDLSTGSVNNVVGVIDTGVDYLHPDLAANIWENSGEIAGNGIDDDGNGQVDDFHGYDFYNNDSDPADDHSHGTAVSGTIGAVGNNARGTVGINWSVKMIACKAFNSAGVGSIATIVSCLNYLTDLRNNYAVNIVATNNSYGGFPNSVTLFNAIAATRSAGMIYVAGAGNDATNSDTSPFYPAGFDLDNIISVGATDSSGDLTNFSNYGATTVDIGAPGLGVYTTLPNNQYGAYQGTSIATPHVTGVVALLMAYHPTYSYLQVRSSILNTGTVMSGLANKSVSGAILNVAAALQYAAPEIPIPTPVPTNTSTPPSNNGGEIDVTTAKLRISVLNSKQKSTVRCDLVGLNGSDYEGVPDKKVFLSIKGVSRKRHAITQRDGGVTFTVRPPKGRSYSVRCSATLLIPGMDRAKTIQSKAVTLRSANRRTER